MMQVPARATGRWRCVAAGMLLAASSASYAASPGTPERDPTVAPPHINPELAQTAAPTNAALPPSLARPIVIAAEGRYYVMEAGQRRSIGDKFGAARIEHIDDSAVWLRESGTTRRIQLNGHVAKRKTLDATPAASRPDGASPTGRAVTARAANHKSNP